MNKYDESIERLDQAIEEKIKEEAEIHKQIDNCNEEKFSVKKSVNDNKQIVTDLERIINIIKGKKDLIINGLSEAFFSASIFTICSVFFDLFVNKAAILETILLHLVVYILLFDVSLLVYRIKENATFKIIKTNDIEETEEKLIFAKEKQKELEDNLAILSERQTELNKQHKRILKDISKLNESRSLVVETKEHIFYNIFSDMSEEYKDLINQEFENILPSMPTKYQKHLQRILSKKESDN